ncbi:MAG: L-Ala-D/L-Glu epimerase [Syntrophorhabdus sp. PtaU1.Bin050]|nr:MAG: L-Ala-D/L-Glu epimerase [Syntrophorhabdus sp. PtaU1.Bin050]
MNRIKGIHFREIVRPLRVTFSTAAGSKHLTRSVIVEATLSDGAKGIGECPTSLAFKDESLPVMTGVLKEAAPVLCGMPIDHYEEGITGLRKTYAAFPMTVSGLEVALFRAFLTSKGITEHAYWGGRTRTVPTDITIPFVPDKAFLLCWMKYAFRKGFTVYKLKVSGDPEQDRDLISFVCGVLRDNVNDYALRLDGNQGYNRDRFLRFVDHINKADYRIELFEQPLPREDYKGMRSIRHASPIPVILDETVLTGEDAQRVVDEGLADGVNIKVAKSGIRESRIILDIAQKHHLSLMIGCMTETMAGLSAGIHLTAGTGAFDFIDLDSIYFLYHRNRYGMIQIQGPRFTVE